MNEKDKQAIVEAESKKSIAHFLDEIKTIKDKFSWRDIEKLTKLELIKDNFEKLLEANWQPHFNSYYDTFWQWNEHYLKIKSFLDKKENNYQDLINFTPTMKLAEKVKNFRENEKSYIIPFIEEKDKTQTPPTSYTSMTKWLGTSLYPVEILNEGSLLSHTYEKIRYYNPETFTIHDITHSEIISKKININGPSKEDSNVACKNIRKCFEDLAPASPLEKKAIFFIIHEIDETLDHSNNDTKYLDEIKNKYLPCIKDPKSFQCPPVLVRDFIYDSNVTSFIKENRELYKKVCMNKFDKVFLPGKDPFNDTLSTEDSQSYLKSLENHFDKETLSFIFSKKVCLWIENNPGDNKIAIKKDAELNQAPKELVDGVRSLLNSYESKVSDFSNSVNSMANKMNSTPSCKIFMKEQKKEIQSSENNTCKKDGNIESDLAEPLAIRNLNENVVDILVKVASSK